jgi:hypothetical protein
MISLTIDLAPSEKSYYLSIILPLTLRKRNTYCGCISVLGQDFRSLQFTEDFCSRLVENDALQGLSRLETSEI